MVSGISFFKQSVFFLVIAQMCTFWLSITHTFCIFIVDGAQDITLNDSGVLPEAMLPEVSLAPVKDDDLKGIKEALVKPRLRN